MQSIHTDLNCGGVLRLETAKTRCHSPPRFFFFSSARPLPYQFKVDDVDSDYGHGQGQSHCKPRASR